MNGKKIKFSEESKKETRRIISYLSNEWSESVVDKFISILERKISNIQLFPKSYQVFDKQPDVRKCVVTKQISLYYKVSDDEIEVITLFDSRQDPDKLKEKFDIP